MLSIVPRARPVPDIARASVRACAHGEWPRTAGRGGMAVVEVERKFVLSEDSVRALDATEHTVLHEALVFTDVYYDDAAWRLTLRDRWLRQREGHWQLKLPLSSSSSSPSSCAAAPPLDRYRELTAAGDIAGALGFDPAEAVRAGTLAPFCRIRTTRRSLRVRYRGRLLRVDMDAADFGFAVGEVEALAESAAGRETDDERAQVERATRDVLDFAVELGLIERGGNRDADASVPGKVVEYLRRKRPEHLQALLDHGVIMHGA